MSRLLSSEQGGFERGVVTEAKSRDDRFVVLVFGWIRGAACDVSWVERVGDAVDVHGEDREEMVFEQTEGPSSKAAEKMGKGRRWSSCDEDRQRERRAEKRK